MSATTAPRVSGLRRHARGMAVGLALGLTTDAFAALLNHEDALVYLAIVVGAIGWVYLGFAIADGRPSAIAVQAGSAVVFLNVAFLGAQHDSELLLGLGFLAHAAWDWLHHDGHGRTHVRTWYPPFCVVADVVIAVPLLAGWV
jgi:Family of unknown function (DUF6010)